MPVGGHHPHPLGTQLPEHPIENRAALFGARRECHMTNQLLELFGGGPPTTLEFQTGKRGELLSWEAEEPETRATALDGHPLLTGGGEPDSRAGELADN